MIGTLAAGLALAAAAPAAAGPDGIAARLAPCPGGLVTTLVMLRPAGARRAEPQMAADRPPRKTPPRPCGVLA